jgi:hypothetical protein
MGAVGGLSAAQRQFGLHSRSLFFQLGSLSIAGRRFQLVPNIAPSMRRPSGFIEALNGFFQADSPEPGPMA